jgi:hypothetical protein
MGISTISPNPVGVGVGIHYGHIQPTGSMQAQDTNSIRYGYYVVIKPDGTRGRFLQQVRGSDSTGTTCR